MNEPRPEMTATELNRLFVVLLAMASILLLVSAYAWFQLSDDVRVPVHWGPSGEVDRYAGKTRGLFMLPAIAVTMAVVLRVIPSIEPRRRNLLRSLVAYRGVSITIMAFFVVLHVNMVANLLGWTAIGVTSVIGLLISVLIMVMGNYLGKVRSNFMFGIRTPWTLSSDLAWNKTHRLGGRILVASGIAGIVLNVVWPGVGLRVFIAILVVGMLATVVYSYLVWRTAPDRRDGEGN